jgi:hypothetical protein
VYSFESFLYKQNFDLAAANSVSLSSTYPPTGRTCKLLCNLHVLLDNTFLFLLPVLIWVVEDFLSLHMVPWSAFAHFRLAVLICAMPLWILLLSPAAILMSVKNSLLLGPQSHFRMRTEESLDFKGNFFKVFFVDELCQIFCSIEAN